MTTAGVSDALAFVADFVDSFAVDFLELDVDVEGRFELVCTAARR